MQSDELLRAVAAFMTFSFGIALLLVSLIVVFAAMTHAPLFSVVGIGGMLGAAFIMQMSHTIVAPRPVTLAISDDGD